MRHILAVRRAVYLCLGALLAAGLLAACGSPQTGAATQVRVQVPAATATPCDKCGKDRTPRPTATPTRVRGTAIGQEAPDFALASLQGGTQRLSDFRGQVVLLNFWATWCGPCRMEVPGLVAAHERYKGQGFTVVAVDLGEPKERVEAFAGEFRMTFPVLLDEAGSTRELYRTRGIPTSFLLDREGIVRNVIVGAMPDEYIVQLVESLLGT